MGEHSKHSNKRKRDYSKANQSEYVHSIKKRKQSDVSGEASNTMGRTVDSGMKKETTNKTHDTRKNSFEKAGKISNIPKKPDWKKMKEKKKILKVERKKKRSTFEVGVKAKQLWEQLRKRDCSKEKKVELTELHNLLQGSYSKAVFSHDVGRVVQWLLKTGTKEIHQDIVSELKGHFVEMAHSKYGSFCVKQLLKRGSKDIKDTVINSFLGNIVKLMSHRVASPIVSNVYSTYANSLQKCHMRQEFYSDIFRVMKNDDVKNLKLALQLSHDMTETILNTTKTNLLKIINKDLVESQLVNAVLGEFISLTNESDRSEVITAINSFLPLLTQTKVGAKVGMMCLWHGTQKDRKVVIKSLKGSISQIAVCEHGCLVLLSLFDCVDDTVLVRKALLSEVITNVLNLAKDKCGRRVILYLVAPRDPLYFHPDVVDILKLGDGNTHSKKPAEVRRAELCGAVSDSFLESIANHVSEWFSDSSVGMVALSILKAGEGPKLKDAFEALAAYVCQGEENKDEEAVTSIVEDSGLHLVLKKLIVYDKVRHDKCIDAVLFSEVLVAALDGNSLSWLISSNRGCFTLVALLEINIPKVEETLTAKISGSISDKISELKSKGGDVLRKKLTK